MGRGTILSRENIRGRSSTGRSTPEGGWSLVELSVTLALLIAVSLFGVKTMAAGFLLQNWSIGRSMTAAYAGIETAYAQRYVFADIPNGGSSGVPVWGVYPLAVTTNAVTIGYMPSLATPATAATTRSVTATVIRTYHTYTDSVTNAVSYLLESYVVYQDGQRNYCKVSKVYRSE
jgi:hypothetical protein